MLSGSVVKARCVDVTSCSIGVVEARSGDIVCGSVVEVTDLVSNSVVEGRVLDVTP